MTMTTSSSSNSGGSSATTIIDLLRKACTNEILPLSNNSSLSEDGNILTIYEDGSSYDATSLITVTVRDGKSSTTTSTKDVTYSLASIYLQLLHPEDVLTYRKACGHYKVKDPVKVLDKSSITEYFGDGGNDVELLPPLTTTTTTTTTTDSGAEKEDFKDDAAGDDDDDDAMDYDDLSGDDADVDAAGKASSSKRRTKEVVLEDKKRPRSGSSSNSKSRGRDNTKLHHGESSSSRKKRSSKSSSQQREDEDRRIGSSSSSKGKAPKGPITNEQLVANLSTIVDKRDIGGGLVMGTPTKAAKVATTRTSTTTTNDEDDTNEATGPTTTTTTTTGFTPTTTATTPMLSDDEQGQQQGGFSQNSTTDEVDDAIMILGSSTTTTTTTTSDYDRDLLLAWLSPEGFQVDSSPSVAAAIEADREAVRRITALEIPVGDSASILRAGAGGEIAVDKSGTELTGGGSGTPGGGGGGNIKKRDFARVLEIYQEVVAAEEGAKRLSSSSSSGKRPPPPPPPPSSSSLLSKSPHSSGPSGSAATSGGCGITSSTKPANSNPIIVVPNAMTSAITMTNAGFFLGKDAVFIPRDQAMQNPAAGKRGGTISITRKLAPRLGGAEITYDIIDNPVTRLKKDDWNKVVAVICQGAAWQFKGWRYSDPVDLFSRTFGFYVGLEGASVPNELRGWNVKTGKVSRDRRGLDNVCLASFWNGLEEFMAVHKQQFIQSS